MRPSKFLRYALILLSFTVVFTACKDDDEPDNSLIDKFIGSYDADMTSVFFGIVADTTEVQYIMFIEASASGAEDEIDLRNPVDQNYVVTAKVSGNDFIIQSNTHTVTGNGTLSIDSNTIEFEYSAPQEVGWGTLTKR